ncbi:hypothetical protein QJQ45_026845, partial [Haematococcus lacustris]
MALDRATRPVEELPGDLIVNMTSTTQNVASANKTNGASGVLPPASAVTATAETGPALGALQANGEDVLDDIGLDQFDSPSTPNRLTSAAAGRGWYKDFDVLLGNDWLNEHEAVMSYQDKTLSLACDKGEPVVLPCPPADKSESGQSAVSNPASFLVNALRAKPPLASAKVAARWLRKGGTGVLALITVDNSSTPDPAPAEPDLPPGVSKALNALLDEYADVFAPITSLPPERPVGHAIPLVPDARPSVVPQYRMSQEEHAELKKQVQDLLAKGMIEPSSSPFAAPILFVKKKSGELRMCLDYRQLNKITIRDQYPLPRIDDLFDKLSGCTVFSSLDLQAGYNQIRITPEDVPKTAFRTPDGHYQFKVLSFGLCSAPATFQRVMNDAFAPVLNQCALVYLDDILVMSKSVDEHLKHLRKVFDPLRLNKLYAKQSKCEFMRTTLKFLGHVIFAGAIAVDPEKIKSISSWPVPQSLQQLQSFLGAANFVRKFVHNFSVLAAPLTDLCGKAGDSFLWQNWPADELKAFVSLKAAVAQVPMLRLPDHTQPFQVYCDASLQGVGAVLMQDGYPLAYLSKKLSSAERNYTTGEQELLALITACKEWRCYLEGVPFTLFTDHKPLTALPTQKVLSRRQARWMEFLSRFTFDLQYLPGDANPADPLSRIPAGPQDCAMVCVVTTRRQAKQSLERGEVRVAQALPQVPPVGTPSNAPTAVDALAPRPTVSDNPVAAHHSRLPELEAPSAADTSVHYPAAPAHPLELADHLVHGYRLDPAFTAEADLSGMYMDDHGLWRRTGKGTVMVPNDPELREYILHEMHDAAYAGHVGITKTLERLSRVFYWDTMRADVRHYVTTCDACQRDKSSTLKPGGLLNPLSIPDYRWESVSMDLITKLPSASHGFDAICVFVDRLSKMVHFVPCKESMNAKGFARLFVDNVFKLHGLPKDMVSDRGPHFHNTFWHHVQKLLGMRGSLSSSYHPQSDGQTERYNRVLEEMLRHYISPTQADWPDYLSLAEFAVNNSWQESIKSTPFLVNTGQSPITPMLHSLPDKGRCPEGLSYATWWQEAVAKAKLCMQAAQQRQAAYANQDRREVHYKVGQMVLLSTKNMRLKPGKARKLLPRFVGPFKVLGLVGQVAVNLQLPASMSRLHPVFHVSLIKPYTGTDVGFMPPPVEWLDEEPVYYVERLLDHRHVHAGKAKEYLVQWEGYDADHNTWEPRSNLVGCDKILAEYNAAHNLNDAEEAPPAKPVTTDTKAVANSSDGAKQALIQSIQATRSSNSLTVVQAMSKKATQLSSSASGHGKQTSNKTNQLTSKRECCSLADVCNAKGGMIRARHADPGVDASGDQPARASGPSTGSQDLLEEILAGMQPATRQDVVTEGCSMLACQGLQQDGDDEQVLQAVLAYAAEGMHTPRPRSASRSQPASTTTSSGQGLAAQQPSGLHRSRKRPTSARRLVSGPKRQALMDLLDQVELMMKAREDEVQGGLSPPSGAVIMQPTQPSATHMESSACLPTQTMNADPAPAQGGGSQAADSSLNTEVTKPSTMTESAALPPAASQQPLQGQLTKCTSPGGVTKPGSHYSPQKLLKLRGSPGSPAVCRQKRPSQCLVSPARPPILLSSATAHASPPAQLPQSQPTAQVLPTAQLQAAAQPQPSATGDIPCLGSVSHGGVSQVPGAAAADDYDDFLDSVDLDLLEAQALQTRSIEQQQPSSSWRPLAGSASASAAQSGSWSAVPSQMQPALHMPPGQAGTQGWVAQPAGNQPAPAWLRRPPLADTANLVQQISAGAKGCQPAAPGWGGPGAPASPADVCGKGSGGAAGATLQQAGGWAAGRQINRQATARQRLVGNREEVHYQVQHVQEDLHGDKRLDLVSPINGSRAVLHLSDMWQDLPVQPGDSLNVIRPRDQGCEQGVRQLVCSASEGLCVLHPDILLSGTTVTSAMDCTRKAWLSELFGGGANNDKAVLGTLSHELVQWALLAAVQGPMRLPSRAQCVTQAHEIVAASASKLFEVGVSADVAVKALTDKVTALLAWLAKYVGAGHAGPRDLVMGPNHQ